MPIVLAPAEVLAGLVAICILFAGYLVAQIVLAVLNAVPFSFVLGPIKDAVNWLGQHALDGMGWLWAKTNPVAVWTALVNIWHDTEQGFHTVLFGDINGALQWLYHSAIPAAANWAVGAAQAAIAPFVAGVNAFIGGVLGFITWAHAQFAALWNAVTVSLPGLIRAEVAVVETDLGTAVRFLEGDIAAAEAQAVHAIAVAISGVEGWVGTQIGTAVRQVEGDLGVVRDLVTASVIPALGVLTRELTQVVERVVTQEECTAGICGPKVGNELGQLGQLLQGLEKLVEGGVIFALLAEAVRDAPGVGHEIEQVIGGTVNGAADALRSAVGLAA
jgi:hypothetical protein